jgi:hypothetical protein
VHREGLGTIGEEDGERADRCVSCVTRLARHRLRLRIATADAAGNTAAGTVAVALRLPRR